MKVLSSVFNYLGKEVIEEFRNIKNANINFIVEYRLKSNDYSKSRVKKVGEINIQINWARIIIFDKVLNSFIVLESSDQIMLWKYHKREIYKIEQISIQTDENQTCFPHELKHLDDLNNQNCSIFITKEKENFIELIGPKKFKGLICAVLKTPSNNDFNVFDFWFIFKIIDLNEKDPVKNVLHCRNQDIYCLNKINNIDYLSLKDEQSILIFKKSENYNEDNTYIVKQNIDNIYIKGEYIGALTSIAVLSNSSFVVGTDAKLIIYILKDDEYVISQLIRTNSEGSIFSIVSLNENCFLSSSYPTLWYKNSSKFIESVDISLKNCNDYYYPIIRITENTVLAYSDKFYQILTIDN